jgi:hypothetical protein
MRRAVEQTREVDAVRDCTDDAIIMVANESNK